MSVLPDDAPAAAWDLLRRSGWRSGLGSAPMYAGFILIGVFFGLALAVTVGLFYVLGLDGSFRANLEATARELCDRVTGRRRYVPGVTGERRQDVDPRVRSLQEELRLANRLLEQARSGQQSDAEQARRAVEENATLRQDLAARDGRIGELEAQLQAATGRQEALREQLAERAEQLARSQRDVRDLQTELDVLQSGVSVVNQ